MYIPTKTAFFHLVVKINIFERGCRDRSSLLVVKEIVKHVFREFESGKS